MLPEPPHHHEVAPMLLKEIVDLVLGEREWPVVPGTRNNWYLPAIADFRDYLHRDPSTDDLSRDSVNGWIDYRLQESRLSRYTIKTRRGALLAIWRGLYELDELDAGPQRIRKVRLTQANPIAWSREEVQQLLSYVLHEMPSQAMVKTGLPRSLFFGSLIAAGYDTALRLGDLLSLEREWIRTDKAGAGWLQIQQSKTGYMVASRLNPETMLLVDRLVACNPNRRLIWPLGTRREAFYHAFRKVVLGASIRRGTFRFLRRASTTHIEQIAPGTSHLHAGHVDPAITRRFYIDADQLQSSAVSPLALKTKP